MGRERAFPGSQWQQGACPPPVLAGPPRYARCPLPPPPSSAPRGHQAGLAQGAGAAGVPGLCAVAGVHRKDAAVELQHRQAARRRHRAGQAGAQGEGLGPQHAAGVGARRRRAAQLPLQAVKGSEGDDHLLVKHRGRHAAARVRPLQAQAPLRRGEGGQEAEGRGTRVGGSKWGGGRADGCGGAAAGERRRQARGRHACAARPAPPPRPRTCVVKESAAAAPRAAARARSASAARGLTATPKRPPRPARVMGERWQCVTGAAARNAGVRAAAARRGRPRRSAPAALRRARARGRSPPATARPNSPTAPALPPQR